MQPHTKTKAYIPLLLLWRNFKQINLNDLFCNAQLYFFFVNYCFFRVFEEIIQYHVSSDSPPKSFGLTDYGFNKLS